MMLKRLRPAHRRSRIRKRSNVTIVLGSINTHKQFNKDGTKTTNPKRLGIIRGWDSNWYGGNDYGDKLPRITNQTESISMLVYQKLVYQK
jgi:small subunit ribosomal protein S3